MTTQHYFEVATALMFAGGVVAVAAALLLAAVGLFAIWSLLGAAISKIEMRGEARQIAWQQNKLRSAAWWFSEDQVTMTLLADLSELSEWDAREKWRKARHLSTTKEPRR